jgi:hypothetical protein
LVGATAGYALTPGAPLSLKGYAQPVPHYVMAVPAV